VRVFRQPAELNPGTQPVCAALGFFDGVHRGHQEVLRRTRNRATALGALALAVTFDRHPTVVVAPDRVPQLIQTLDQRLEAMAALRLDAAWVIEFTPAFSNKPGADFVRHLVRSFGRVLSLHVGERFHFGHRRSGNVAVLRDLEAELGYATESVAGVLVDGETVSSTRIRDAIRRGDIAAAVSMLGRPYALRGPVVPGDRVGRSLGFPTANLGCSDLVLPPNGVYTAHARRIPFPPDNADLSTSDDPKTPPVPAVVSIGVRPSLAQESPARRVEAHLLDWSEDLYGQSIEITFETRLRDEQKFSSLDTLRHQIASDVAAARVAFATPR
jgi:riboflavin kinase/FMN adenylyltransferase